MTKLQLGIFIGGITVTIALVVGIVGSIVGLEQGFMAGLTAALVYVTGFYAYLTSRTVEIAKQSAEVSKKIAEEAKEARLATSAPILLQRTAYNLPDERYFSHFVVWNAGNGTAIELIISILNERKQPIEGSRIPFLKPGEERMFKPSNLTKLENVKCYLVATYMDISHLTGEKVFNQTWLPFIVQKARSFENIEIRDVDLGELSFKFGIPEKDLPAPIPLIRDILPK
jgi:phosphoribosyl-ATP pyrophosphohydrolase